MEILPVQLFGIKVNVSLKLEGDYGHTKKIAIQ